MDERKNKRNPLERLLELLQRKPAEAPAPSSDPAAPAPGEDASSTVPAFSLDDLARRLYRADDTAAALTDYVAHAEKRMAAGEPVAPLEAFLVHALIDAGVGSNDVKLPSLTIVRPHTSNLFYVRVNEAEMPYLALLHVLGIEAALNVAQLATIYYGEAGPATEAQAWQFAHRLSSSIIAQMKSDVSSVIQGSNHDAGGEWSVRTAISMCIECFKLPWRLSARFRVNVAAGEVAFVCDLTPTQLMWRRTSIDGVHVVPVTAQLQRQAATDYNTRLAILLAACAFDSSPQVERVWVAGTIDTAKRHSCLYSVCFDREGFEHISLDDVRDPVAVLKKFDAAIDEHGGTLSPVQQTFSLDDERFCPPERFEAPEVSARILPDAFAQALGTTSVAGLAINEAGRREAIAREISRRLGDSTAANVSTILELAADDTDPTVRAAAERTVKKLIEGSISENVFDIVREFTEGDELYAAVARARMLLEAQEIHSAEAVLSTVLADLAQVYADSSSVVYRVFTSYVDRVIYNRLGFDEGKTVLLAPVAYLEALLMHSISLMLLKRYDEALAAARRAKELAPVNAQAQLHLVQCLEAADRTLEAVEELSELLSRAHDTAGVGFGYYRMAYFQWKLGQVECAQACYLRAIRHLPTMLALAAPELQVMALQSENRLDDISDGAVDALLEKHGIPLAPTQEMGDIFFEAMCASLDAEIFPVAKSFLQTFGSMQRDDVVFGVLRSLEDEPDR